MVEKVINLEIINALKVQGRVISALTLRETRARYGDSRLGFFWAFFEPLAHIVVFVGIFSVISRAIPIGDSIALFILTGIIPWQLYNNISSNTMSATKGNQSLLGYPQVMPLDIVISRIILDYVTLLIVMIVFLLAFQYLGTTIKIDNILNMLIPSGLLILFGTGIGLINAAIDPYFPAYKNIFRAFSRPLYFISGVFFTVDFLPPEARKYILFNPILHLIEWFRSGFYTSFESQLYDPQYAINACTIIFFIGFSIERISSKRARQII